MACSAVEPGRIEPGPRTTCKMAASQNIKKSGQQLVDFPSQVCGIFCSNGGRIAVIDELERSGLIMRNGESIICPIFLTSSSRQEFQETINQFTVSDSVQKSLKNADWGALAHLRQSHPGSQVPPCFVGRLPPGAKMLLRITLLTNWRASPAVTI